MNKIYFKYKEHPGDLFRNTAVAEFPNPDENLEDFLVWFLTNYQSDSRVTYLNNLYKALHNEFTDESERVEFIKYSGKHTKQEIEKEIEITEQELKNESYQNFYSLILRNKIEIIENGKN